MGLLTDVAAAVTAELNGHVFSRPFTAARSYRPVFDLAEMSVLHVSVVPKSHVIERFDRNRNQHDVQVDIAVQQKPETAANADLDPLVALVEEIADFFRLRRLVAYPDAVWVKTENLPVYSPEHLDQFGQFTSVLTLTYRVAR